MWDRRSSVDLVMFVGALTFGVLALLVVAIHKGWVEESSWAAWAAIGSCAQAIFVGVALWYAKAELNHALSARSDEQERERAERRRERVFRCLDVYEVVLEDAFQVADAVAGLAAATERWPSGVFPEPGPWNRMVGAVRKAEVGLRQLLVRSLTVDDDRVVELVGLLHAGVEEALVVGRAATGIDEGGTPRDVERLPDGPQQLRDLGEAILRASVNVHVRLRQLVGRVPHGPPEA